VNCAVSQQEYTQIFPQSGWGEHDPQKIWSPESSVISKAMAQLGVSEEDIAGIGITNQRETTIVWDAETGEPVYNAIVWQDRRTAEYCDELKAQGLTDLIHEKTGLLIDAEPGSRCLVCLSDGRTVFDSAIANGNQKITLQQGQVYILTLDGRTLKFAL